MSWLDKMGKPKNNPKNSGATSVRSVNYSSSPLLASKTPPWRSKFFVAMVGLGFCVLLGRAAGARPTTTCSRPSPVRPAAASPP